MSATLVLLLLASQPPEQPGAVVLLTRRTGASEAVGNGVVRDVRKALAAAGVGSPLTPEGLNKKLLSLGVKDSKSCEGKRACVLELGKQLGVANVVSLSVGQIATDVAIRIEAFRISDGAKLAEDTVAIGANDLRGVEGALGPFAHKLLDALASPRVVDAPRVEPLPTAPLLIPEPIPPGVTLTPAPPPPSRVPAFIAGGATVLGLGATAFFAGTGFSLKGQVNEGMNTGGRIVSVHTIADAQAIADSANTRLTIGLVCGVTTVLLATATAILWGASSPHEEPAR